MHVTAPSLAERYLGQGYDLERLPLPPPFDFLARAPDDAQRVAAFHADDRVTAPTMIDVRLMARDLGARAVFIAPAFSDEARRIAERLGIEVVDVPPGEGGDGAPAAAPPQADEALDVHGAAEPPAPFPELAVDPVLVQEARAHPDFADFPEDPTPEELRDELRHVNAVLDHRPARAALTRDQLAEAALAESAPFEELRAPPTSTFAFVPQEIPTHVLDEVLLPDHPVHEPGADLARWYDDLCALEARTLADEELADWYDALLMLEADALAREAEEALGLRALAALADAVPAPPSDAFRLPASTGSLVWPSLAELTPLARAGHVLVPEPAFAAGGASAFRALEDAVPALPAVAFEVVHDDVEDDAEEAAPAPMDPFLPPSAVLPWTPTRATPAVDFVPALPHTGLPPAEVLDDPHVLPWKPVVRAPEDPADPTPFIDAFEKAQAWNTLQRIESVRREAHEAVQDATGTPKRAPVADDADYELL